MIDALRLFYKLIESTKTADIMYRHFHMNNMGNVVDCSDLLRWRWVQSVSALDKFVHDIVKIGMVEIFSGHRIATPKYNNFKIGLATLTSMLLSDDIEKMRIMEQQIFKQNGYKAFQTPTNISDALSYIWNENSKWKLIAAQMPCSPNEDDVKTELNNISIRRNQIVHEGDCQSDILPLQRQNIEKEDVDNAVLFISDIAESIYNCIITTSSIPCLTRFHLANPANVVSRNIPTTV